MHKVRSVRVPDEGHLMRTENNTNRCKQPKKRKGIMNKDEAAYAKELEALRLSGEIEGFAYEGMTLRLAPKTSYTPDFLVVYHDGFEFHEIKGFERDDAIAKFKIAAEMFPWFGFKMIKKTKSGFVVTRDL